MNEELQRLLGAAAVIFSILFGMGSCVYMASLGDAELARAKRETPSRS